MATTNLGRVRFRPRGDYNPAADPFYSLLDLVSFGGGSFVYINDTPSNEPTSSTSHWQQIAEKGETGPEGPQGIQGVQGSDGADGLTVSVCGVEHVDGDINLTASDIPTSTAGVSVQGTLDEHTSQLADIEDDALNNRASALVQTAIGNPVTFSPVYGSALELLINIEVNQAGSGDPSPTNVRAITGHDTLTITHTDEVTPDNNLLTPVSPFYGFPSVPDKVTVSKNGEISGEHNTAQKILNGTEFWEYSSNSGTVLRFYSPLVGAYANNTTLNCWSSHFNGVPYGSIAYVANRIAINNTPRIYINVDTTLIGTTVEATSAEKKTALVAWLTANPVTTIYRIATPTTESFEALAYTGKNGENTISTDVVGNVNIVYNEDLTAHESAFLVDYNVEKIKITNTRPKFSGKNVLVIGESTSAYDQWQPTMAAIQECTYATHARGGFTFVGLLVGGEGLAALAQSDVSDKDAIIIFAGINDSEKLKGALGEVYPTNNTVAGGLQYLLDGIYALLLASSNLDCKIFVVAPYCHGGDGDTYPVDGYSEYPPASGQTFKDVCDMICAVAEHNNCHSLNLWRKSGIGRYTWDIYKSTTTDKVHLNTLGYQLVGGIVAAEMNLL